MRAAVLVMAIGICTVATFWLTLPIATSLYQSWLCGVPTALAELGRDATLMGAGFVVAVVAGRYHPRATSLICGIQQKKPRARLGNRKMKLIGGH